MLSTTWQILLSRTPLGPTIHQQVSHSAHCQHSPAYRLTAPCTTVVCGANDLHIAELREKSAQLMRNKTQYTSLIFPLGLLRISPRWWRKCVEAAKKWLKDPDIHR